MHYRLAFLIAVIPLSIIAVFALFAQGAWSALYWIGTGRAYDKEAWDWADIFTSALENLWDAGKR